MSTIARTPLSYFLTILMAENVLRLVTPGTHKHDQYVNPIELEQHFRTHRPWISAQPASFASHWPRRMQYETRGTFYVPGVNRWSLASREANQTLTQSANYFFWVRKPTL
jgi:2-polyprenyl-6-hydroxyphenyl methylase/3-demethylubiquinone-9 3-methyltransferase